MPGGKSGLQALPQSPTALSRQPRVLMTQPTGFGAATSCSNFSTQPPNLTVIVTFLAIMYLLVEQEQKPQKDGHGAAVGARLIFDHENDRIQIPELPHRF